jgi:AcrR family transcriptional regulator
VATEQASESEAPAAAAEALMAAATQLFTKQGYEKTSVAEIVKLAGSSVGTLYYHYGGKAEIFMAMYMAYIGRQDQRVREALHLVKGAGVTDPRLLFMAGTRAYLTGIWKDREVSRVVAHGQTPGEFSKLSRQVGDDWTIRNITLLAESEEPIAAKAVASAVAGAMGRWAIDIVELSNFEEANEYIDQAAAVVERMTMHTSPAATQ